MESSRAVACENIRFSSLFAVGEVSHGVGSPPRETSPATKSEEKRMFSQATRARVEKFGGVTLRIHGLLHSSIKYSCLG